LTGALGCICWLAMALLHEAAGDSMMQTGSYSQGVALAGLAPLFGLVPLLLFWGRTPEKTKEMLPVGGGAVKEPIPAAAVSEAIRTAGDPIRQ
jgi:hypothetical protein